MNTADTKPLAATGDTWGIAGPAFLNAYLIAAVVAVVVVLIVRMAVTRGDRRASTQDIDPEALGFLAGGRMRAFYVALTALRALGQIGTSSRGTIVASGTGQYPLSELQQAIMQVAGSGVRTTSAVLDRRLTPAMNRIQDGLRSAGLMTNGASRAACRIVALPLVALEILGFARVASAGEHPVRNLIIAMVVLGFVTLVLMTVVPRTTSAGRSLLRRQRSGNAHLRSSSHPSWVTYGAAGAGLSVALFGVSTLYAMDPAFAAEARIPMGTAGGSSGSSSSCSSGSSCGGGSSSSCGGGSGCGGGGGCGG